MSEPYHQLVASLAPSHVRRPSGAPSISHCVGVGRLLGEFYGHALSEALGLKEPTLQSTLSTLSVLMRAYIVLDDYMKDSTLSKNDTRYISNWTERIADRCRAMIDKFNGPEMLWESYISRYEVAFVNQESLSAYTLVLSKCSFLFLPFDLPIYNASTTQTIAIRHFIEHYLFSLQLLDDFADMEEDTVAPVNTNILMRHLTDTCAGRLISRRYHLVPSLIHYIDANMVGVTQGVPFGYTMDRFWNWGRSWLENKKGRYSAPPVLNLFQSDYLNFDVTNECLSGHLRQWNDRPYEDLSDITAQGLHTPPPEYGT